MTMSTWTAQKILRGLESTLSVSPLLDEERGIAEGRQSLPLFGEDLLNCQAPHKVANESSSPTGPVTADVSLLDTARCGLNQKEEEQLLRIQEDGEQYLSFAEELSCQTSEYFTVASAIDNNEHGNDEIYEDLDESRSHVDSDAIYEDPHESRAPDNNGGIYERDLHESRVPDDTVITGETLSGLRECRLTRKVCSTFRSKSRASRQSSRTSTAGGAPAEACAQPQNGNNRSTVEFEDGKVESSSMASSLLTEDSGFYSINDVDKVWTSESNKRKMESDQRSREELAQLLVKFQRCTRNIHNSTWLCDIDNATKLAALEARAHYGDHIPALKNLQDRIEKCFPLYHRADKPAMNRAMDAFKETEGWLTSHSAMHNYTEFCSQLETFEATGTFSVKLPINKVGKMAVYTLVVAPVALVVLHPETLKLVAKWPMDRIAEHGTNRKNLFYVVLVGDTKRKRIQVMSAEPARINKAVEKAIQKAISRLKSQTGPAMTNGN